ncbi:MAG: DNA-binding MarR family transcriptional regulator [Arenicella sp.]|jgi:DNA-binding MarR family transcriptional regulator
MNALQNSTQPVRASTVAGNHKQSQLTLGLLQAIEQQDDISQRHLAQEMGVALGLANSYLKRCVKKGWIKMTTAPANRYLYYLTPNGFAEKARLTADFFSTSLALFRQSGDEYSAVFDHCMSLGQSRVLLAGLSDLTEIAVMRALQSKIELIAIYQPASPRREFFGVPLVDQRLECDSFDVIVLTSMEQTRELVLELEAFYGADKLIVPSMLLNMNYRNPVSAEQDSSEA